MTKEFDARNEEKSRSVCAAMADAADTGKRVLSEKERRILDMWPRYEDGEPVWFGDGVDGLGGEIIDVYIAENAAYIWNNSANCMHLRHGERVKRPAPEVLDADGVPIKVGDTVYAPRMYGGTSFTVSRFTKNSDGDTIVMVEEMGSGLFPKTVTHTRPAYETRESVVYEIGEDMAKRIDAIVSAGRWK